MVIGICYSTILSLHFPFLRLLYKSLWFQLIIVSLSLNTFLCSHVFDWIGFSVSSMHSTFDFPGGGGVQDGGPDLHWHQHPHHSGGALDQPRADSVEETANTRLTLDKSRQCGDLACASNTRLPTELEPTVWMNQPTPDSVNHVPF